MSRAKMKIHPEGSKHPTEHTFEELLRRIVSTPRDVVDRRAAEERRKKKRKRATKT